MTKIPWLNDQLKKILAILNVLSYNMKVLIYVDNMPSKGELCIENINNFYET